MEIKWHGQSCFQIRSGSVTVIIDPYGPEIGLTLPKLSADIVTISHQHPDHNNAAAIEGNPKIIMTGGITKYKNIEITGIESFHDEEQGSKRGLNLIFTFSIDGIKIVHAGDLGQTSLTVDQLALLKDIDILMIPVGGADFTIDAEGAIKIINQLNHPKIIIPMHYGIKNIVFPLAPVDEFVEKSGIMPSRQDVLEITKESLPQETAIIILSRHQTD